jgi:cytochrome c553
MKIARMLVVSVAVLGVASWANLAHADGKAKFESTCATDCHEKDDFKGESAADLTKKIKEIVATGKMENGKKHKEALKLTDAEIAELAAYLSK